MATKTIYLLDPYNDVIKVNALSDSVFRLDLNKSIIYTQKELFDAIIAVAKLNASEDEVTRIFRFASLHQNNVKNLRYATVNACNLLQWHNSYCDNICGDIAHVIWAIFYHFIGNDQGTIGGGDVNGSHVWNSFSPGYDGCADNINKIPFYKGEYEPANFTDMEEDEALYSEPLKKLGAWHYTKTNYTSYVTNSHTGAMSEDYLSLIDNVYMRMPGGSSFIFPVKSTNVPKCEDGTDIRVYANLILTIPTGVTGSVEMPFNLLQITGTGSVVLDGVTYNLPTDEAALKATCQTTQYKTEKWLHSFSVASNSGGLEVEFLVNYCRVLLFKKNIIDYELSSGAITFERAKTLIPVPTHILAVNKQDSGTWTLDFKTYFTKNKSFKVPLQITGWGLRGIYFLPNTQGKYAQNRWFQNVDVNTVTAIDAGIAVIDKCWAAKLMPRDSSFASTLELSFTAVDDSDTYYTLDGSTPDATKTKYTEPFTISATTTVKWINIKEGYADSHVNSRVITKS